MVTRSPTCLMSIFSHYKFDGYLTKLDVVFVMCQVVPSSCPTQGKHLMNMVMMVIVKVGFVLAGWSSVVAGHSRIHINPYPLYSSSSPPAPPRETPVWRQPFAMRRWRPGVLPHASMLSTSSPGNHWWRSRSSRRKGRRQRKKGAVWWKIQKPQMLI